MLLEVFEQGCDSSVAEAAASTSSGAPQRMCSEVKEGTLDEQAQPSTPRPLLLPLTGPVAARVPYVVSALSSEWRKSAVEGDGGSPGTSASNTARVRVFLPDGCPAAVLQVLLSRLAADGGGTSAEQGLVLAWRATDLHSALRLVQVASMLQLDELLPELAAVVRESVATAQDLALLEATCQRLELPAAVREVAAMAGKVSTPPVGLPNDEQVRGMIASALLTADGKVWRVVQKVIDQREGWPRLAAENAAILLAFATGVHGSIRATPHTGFFWGSRDFLYLVCRYIRARPSFFDVMVSAMFDSVYSMDPELPAEIIDAVFKELLVHEGLSFSQCDHVIAKLMQREDQLEYLFHEWSGVFPTLPTNARRALSKGLLPAVGKCPHAALDFVLKELEMAPSSPGLSRTAWLLPLVSLPRWAMSFACRRRAKRGPLSRA